MSTSPSDSDVARTRILVIEDASVFREMQLLLLQRAGYGVVVCDKPHLAAYEASKQTFEVALINSDAPGVDHPEFILKLRQYSPAIKIIFVIATPTAELTRDLTAAGVSIVLQRPVNPIVLLQKVDEAIGIKVRPGSSRIFALPPETPPTNVSANPFGSNPSASPFLHTSTLLSSSSTPPFASPDSRTPFRVDSAAPFSSIRYTTDSASPFRTESASPFASIHRR